MIFFILSMICMLGALVTIFFGVSTIGRDGTGVKKKSNKLMQLRVGFQAAAIFFLFLALAA